MLLILPAVIAAIVSALMGGMFNVVWANKLKRNSDISTFRYTKIYELNSEINSLDPVNYDLSDIQRLVNQSTDRFTKVNCIYNKALPLLEIEHKKEPSRLLAEAERLSNEMVERLYEDKKAESGGVFLKELLLKRQAFEKATRESFTLTHAQKTHVLPVTRSFSVGLVGRAGFEPATRPL